MQRTYLFVPPEEKAEVEALGARWDDDIKCWYFDLDHSPAEFGKWLPDANDVESPEDAFTIVSDQAFVAATAVSCQQCNSNSEVICIFCERGTASGESLTRFTVSYIRAIDEELAWQLRPWPNFRKVDGSGGESFANHCAHCGSPQDDSYLHTEPGDAFFDIPMALPGSIGMTPLVGTVRLSGDEHFQIE